ncbi:MAG: 50S ribosomal protein L11 methyltransferase [Saprospiraceae bacterium]|nr:50S ribosomal protein L11 methyltransferase [Saprospiraceae bacterium]
MLLINRVLDFGCGSSILAILAEKLGADQVAAIDYDPWSVNNSLENIELNHCKNLSGARGYSNLKREL